MASLPTGFTDLRTVFNNTPSDSQFYNVIGIVVDVLPPTLTRTGQHLFTFKLQDKLLFDSLDGEHGVAVRFFKAQESDLPRVRGRGDVVLIRHIKLIHFQNQPILLAHYSTSFLVFEAEAIPSPAFLISIQKQQLESHGIASEKSRLSMQEQVYVVQLKDEMKLFVPAQAPPKLARANDEPIAPPAAKRLKSNSAFGPKFSLIKNLQVFVFADICGQVVKQYGTQFGCDLYVTDYTENKNMFYYVPPEEDSDYNREGDLYGYAGPPKRAWPGPYGQHVLHLNVKHPHAQFVSNNIEEGDFVLARNVKVILSKAGSYLEGDMWPDSRNPQLVQIRKLMNKETPEIAALLERKEKYWSKRKPLKASNGEATTSKPNRRDRQKLKKIRQRAAAFEQTSTTAPDPALSASSINPHVRCSDDLVPITTIRDILDLDNARHSNTIPTTDISYALPFINARFRARVRIIDFYPHDLTDFTQPSSSHLTDSEMNDDGSEIYDSSSTPRHEWHFALLLKDACKKSSASLEKKTTGIPAPPNDLVQQNEIKENQIWVQVHHEQAQFMFGRGVNDPEDLHENRALLAQLREKLFVLWGNLEERKESERRLEAKDVEMADGDGQTARVEAEATTAELSNLPFECCIMEYGVRVKKELEHNAKEAEHELGWRRMYALSGITIT